jgi:hypothetical protein
MTPEQRQQHFEAHIEPIAIKIDAFIESLGVLEILGVAAVASVLGKVLSDAEPDNAYSELMVYLIKQCQDHHQKITQHERN